MTYMRRNFYELATPPVASETLKRIAEFYVIDEGIRGRSAEERRIIRQQKSRPLTDTFEQRLRKTRPLPERQALRGDPLRPALL
jgi:transposase